MPIVVEHGGERLGGLAALAFLAGQARGTGAPQIPGMGGGGFGGPGGGSIGLGGGRGGGGGGRGRAPRSMGRDLSLSGPSARQQQTMLMDQAAAIETERMKYEAQLEASQWKTEFTFKQRQEIAKFNNARQMIAQNSRFSPYEKQEALRLIDLQQAGIQPSRMPKNPNEPEFEKDREPGKLWELNGGLYRTVIKDGVPTPEVVLRPDQTTEYMITKAQATAEAALEKEMRAAKFKLATEEVPIWGKDDKGATIEKGKRRRTSGETNAAMWEIYGGTRQQLDPDQQQQQPPPIDIEGEVFGGRQPQQEQPPAAAPSPMDRAMAQGMKITKKDRELPGNVGAAAAYVRHVGKRDIKKMSQDEREAFRQAAETIKDYDRTRKYARSRK